MLFSRAPAKGLFQELEIVRVLKHRGIVSGRQGAETAFPDLPDVSRGLRPGPVFRSDGFDTILPYRGVMRKGGGEN